jgi:hypothetical protein
MTGFSHEAEAGKVKWQKPRYHGARRDSTGKDYL